MPGNPEDSRITYLAATDSRNKKVPFGIKRLDRARHTYVIGKTGMGKSTLLENMAIQDIRNGEGMAFVDPHGSSAEKLLSYVPESRRKDVLYFAPFDMEYPVAFNVMEDVGYDKRHLVVSGLISAFRKIWVDTWSARMEYILSNTLLALLEYPGSTLLSVNRMLIDKSYRKKVVENVKDPIVKSFWVDEFATYTDRYTQEATPAIQNKIGQFTSNPLIRNIVGQPNSTFDFRQMMDDKKIIIINLSKGRVGEVNASLLGSMIVTKLYLSAMSRADVSAATLAKLPPFFFYVDEFQSFANQTFADILSEARKYKLNLTIAHQYIEQMEEEVRDAVFGNVGTTIAFRVGPFDAEVLETVFQPKFMQEDLVNLGFAQIYLTLMIDGVGSPPFSAVTLPPFDPPPTTYEDQIIASSREAYARTRAVVEAEIGLWQGSTADERAKESAAASVAAREANARAPISRTGTRSAERPPVRPLSSTSAPRLAPSPRAPLAPRAPVRAPEPSPAPKQQTVPQRPQESRPREPQRQTPPPPPLEGGATSLRDAIAKAQASTPPRVQPPAPKRQPDPGLGDALKRAQSHAPNAPKDTQPQPQRQENGTQGAPSTHHTAPAPKNIPTDKEGEIPEEVLRDMLKTDWTEES